MYKNNIPMHPKSLDCIENCHINKVSTLNNMIWHQRLDYASPTLLSHLSFINTDIVDACKPCDVCPISK